MIKRLNSTELSSAKPRTGMQHVSVLVDRLMKMYEMQAEMNEMRDKEIQAELAADQQILDGQILDGQSGLNSNSVIAANFATSDVMANAQQATFGWE